MKDEDIAKLLELRKAWDKFKSKPKARKAKRDYDAFYQVFWKYGMETPHQLQEFNNEMIREFVTTRISLKGQCDRCVGYEGPPPCQVIWGNQSCYAQAIAGGSPPPITESDVHTSIIKAIQSGTYIEMPTGETIQQEIQPGIFRKGHPRQGVQITDGVYRESHVCPPGHGYYVEIKWQPGFDWYWKP